MQSLLKGFSAISLRSNNNLGQFAKKPTFTPPQSITKIFNSTTNSTIIRGARGKIETDKRRRFEFEKNEGERLIRKALFYDQRLPISFRYFMIRHQPFSPKGSRVLIRNRCTLSGRPRAVYNKFGLCRIKFRDYALCGELPGIRLSSW